MSALPLPKFLGSVGMHTSIAGHNPYNLRLQKEFHHKVVANKGHMSMFIVKSIVVQIEGKGYGSINWSTMVCFHFFINLH